MNFDELNEENTKKRDTSRNTYAEKKETHLISQSSCQCDVTRQCTYSNNRKVLVLYVLYVLSFQKYLNWETCDYVLMTYIFPMMDFLSSSPRYLNFVCVIQFIPNKYLVWWERTEKQFQISMKKPKRLNKTKEITLEIHSSFCVGILIMKDGTLWDFEQVLNSSRSWYRVIHSNDILQMQIPSLRLTRKE